ncbi:MAG: hypothetical protein KBA81_06860, partial [Rhabdochlamydiaceae bacterium]|nr:hypothetical protein [Rhabdochlamydiaceae bacterium]
EAWTWKRGPGSVDLEAWTWKRGPGSVDLEAWTWKRGPGSVDPIKVFKNCGTFTQALNMAGKAL